jgi:hypothetical protein
MNEMGGSCSTNGGEEGAYRVLVGKSEGKNPLGRPRIRWEDNIKWAFTSGMGAWTGLIWLRMGVGDGVLYAVMNLRFS